MTRANPKILKALAPAAAAPAAAFHAAAFLATLALIALIALPPAVEARCAEPAPIQDAIRTADVVIVGTVTALANEDTRATVSVAEVWRGPALPAEVVVQGGPGGRTSVDRTFVLGTRYLFTLTLDEVGDLHDSLCSSTIEWDPQLEALRPPNAVQPAANDAAQPTVTEVAPFDPGSLAGPAAVALAVALALLVAGLLARGRQAKG